MEKQNNENKNSLINKENENHLIVNDFEYRIEKLDEENLKLREIVKKCLSFINLCQCFGNDLEIQRKLINLLINNFNKKANNGLIGDEFELLVINNKFENKPKNCDSYESRHELKSDSEEIYLKPYFRKNLKPNKSELKTEKKTVKSGVKSKHIKSDEKLRQNKKSVNQNNSSLVKSRITFRKNYSKREKPVIESNTTYLCDWADCGKVFKSKQNLKVFIK